MADDPKFTILLVDDEEDILTTLGALMEASFPNSTITTALSGERGLRTLKEHPPDLVMSDFKMPGMDGLQFLGEVRRKQPDTLRVLMTAYPETDLAIRALNEERIQHFCTKPLDPMETVAAIRGLLQERRAKQQRDAALKRGLDAMGKRKPPPK